VITGSNDSNKRFPQLTLESVPPESQALAKEILAISSIGLGGPYNVMLRSPIFARRIKDLLDYLRFNSSLPLRLNEFAILIQGRLWSSQVEWHAHYPIAMRAGLRASVADDLKAKIHELGQEITKDYKNNPPLLVCVLKGAVNFLADLMREIELPVTVDFMAVSSYGAATKTSGVVQILKDLDTDIAGRDVIIVEDIIDSGLTLRYLYDYLLSRHPASLEICAMVHKIGIQRAEIPARWVGISVEPAFLVGYGLDVAGRFRQLPNIHVVNEEHL